MTPLTAAIKNNNLTGTSQEVQDVLNSDVVLNQNNTPQSLSGVADQLAKQGVNPLILINLRYHVRTLPIGGDTFEGLLLTGGGSAGGVDFTNTSVRTQIQYNQVNENTTAEQQAILAGMLLIGYEPGKLWEKLGLTALPTIAELATALAQLAFINWSEEAKQVIDAAVNGEQSNINNLKQQLAEL